MNPLLQKIRDSVIGDRQLITTAFGDKPMIFADYTASGRALTFIERIIRDQVLPNYANTHSESSFTGAATSKLREQARDEVRAALNVPTDYSVLFCGSGATAAIDKLIQVLNLRLPAELNARYQLESLIPSDERPVVFIGPYEHHSNLLPWRECFVDLEVIPLDQHGGIDLHVLAERLHYYQSRPLKIGSFSAASNVTGLKTDVDAVTALLRRFGALSFWDYAAAAPYVAIDVQGRNTANGDTRKDAVFLSPHKFVGGPGTVGVLVVNNALLKNTIPAVSGGGTVTYVTPVDHRYSHNLQRREEGGTPGIVESIRTGLVFRLQQQVGTELIERLETEFVKRALSRWSGNPNIRVLGNQTAPRLSIVSFTVKYKDKDLHYGFLVALLNDLFGIQSRGGCSCAGPYAHHLLDLDMTTSKAIEAELLEGNTILRPGWVRVNFNYFIDEATFDYMLSAVELIATHGWRLLPFYKFDPQLGLWRFHGSAPITSFDLENIDFHVTPTCFDDESSESTQQKIATDKLNDYLALGLAELTRDRSTEPRCNISLTGRVEALRWFTVPQDIDLTSAARETATTAE